MAWMSIAGSVIGGLIQGDAASSAGDTAANASNQATAAQLQMFNTQNQQQEPYRQAGYTALGEILHGFGLPNNSTVANRPGDRYTLQDFLDYNTRIAPPGYLGGSSDAQTQYDRYTTGAPGAWGTSDFDRLGFRKLGEDTSGGAGGSGIDSGYFSHQFNANDLNSTLAPNWKFALDQGIGATKNAGNLQSGLISGNTMKGIADYTLGKSGDLYQQAYNNYTANQSNIFNRLSNIAGLGSAANQQSAGLAGSMAPSIASTITGAGAAQAAGTIGAANAVSGGIGNALGWYNLNQILNRGGGSTSPDV